MIGLRFYVWLIATVVVGTLASFVLFYGVNGDSVSPYRVECYNQNKVLIYSTSLKRTGEGVRLPEAVSRDDLVCVVFKGK